MGVKVDATRDEVRKVQMEHLEQLRAIRAAMLEGGTGTTAGAAAAAFRGGGGGSKEWEALQAENQLLKLKNQKQEYRIQHLIATVEELLASSTKNNHNDNA